MRIRINYQEKEVPTRTTFAEVARGIRESQKDDPVTRSLVATTGQDHIIFSLNGRVVTARQIDSLELKEGDDIRWMHPYAGG
jgi:sulfur carrier protein ThiS